MEYYIAIYPSLILYYQSVVIIQGYILTSEIDGTIQMKSYLTGNPEIRLALNEDLGIGRGGTSAYGTSLTCDQTEIMLSTYLFGHYYFHACGAVKLWWHYDKV